jgi:hypothetical protein
MTPSNVPAGFFLKSVFVPCASLVYVLKAALFWQAASLQLNPLRLDTARNPIMFNPNTRL